MSQLYLILLFILLLSWGYNRTKQERLHVQPKRSRIRFRKLTPSYKNELVEKLIHLFSNTESLINPNETDKQKIISWMSSLSGKNKKAFLYELFDFSAAIGIDLNNILIDNYSIFSPEIETEIQKILFSFCSHNFQASELSKELAAAKRLENWQKGPFKRTNRSLTQQIYSKLAAQDKVKPLDSDLLFSSSREQKKYIENELGKVANDSSLILNCIKQIISESAPPTNGRWQWLRFWHNWGKPKKNYLITNIQ